ncbi:MAG: hypothetical protein HON90_17450 [Halobacteriovoraceae bacterium]|jgi:hypothetical protein|nr:hypothetical protein [Halobacteriovoraceae bacterium]
MKALILSDNEADWEHFRSLFNAYISEIQLVCASNKKEAMDAIAIDGPFAFFILDSQIKNIEPSKLGFDLVDFAGSRPIVFYGHEQVITDRISQALFESNEFNEKLLKPFDREGFLEDFKARINNAIRWAKDEEFEQTLEDVDPEDYIPMKIKSFYLYQTFPYDIFLALTQKTYIKLISANKKYSHSTLASYAKKNVKSLHIKKDDQLKYLESESIKCLKSLRQIDSKDDEIYLLQLRSLTILHQYIAALGISPTVLTLTNATADSLIEVSLNKESIQEILGEYPILYSGVVSKSILTAYLSLFISKKLGWESETTQKKLCVCSFLQDVALPDDNMYKVHSEDDPYLKQFKEYELKAFLYHPVAAANYAKQFTSYSDIDYILASHHELPNRKGFPNKPQSSKLTQICGVFNSAQYIAAEVDGEVVTSTKIQKVIKTMSRNYNTGRFKEVLKILRTLLKIKS